MREPPRIGISLLTLVPGIVGGSEVYARELCAALARVGSFDYRVLVPTIAQDAGGLLPSQVVPGYRASFTLGGRVAAMVGAALRPEPLRRQMRLEDLDGIHFPLSVMLPAVEALPTVVSLLDVQHLTYPGFFSRAERAYRRILYGASVRRSCLVIAISEHVRCSLIERLHVHPDRVRTVHLGVDHDGFRPGPARRQPFLLYPANRWPHKNHERLFAAFQLVRRQRPELALVLTGAGHQELPLPDGVRSSGLVSREDLIRLYQTAAAVVFPSLYEGFGMPVLEAMACGCPVAAARAAALPEVCGGAARLFDPTSTEDMAAAVLDTLATADELRARGIARAASFSWEECARQHEAVYRDLAQS